MAIEFGPLMTGVAGGGVVGGITGFAMKKLANLIKKLIIVVIGLQLAIFAAAENYGLVSVDWAGVNKAVVGLFGWFGDVAADVTPTIMDTAMAIAPASGGFLGGFLIGFKSG